MASRRLFPIALLLSAMIWPVLGSAQPCRGQGPGDGCPRGGLPMGAGRTRVSQSPEQEKVAPVLREAAAAVQERMLNGTDGSEPDAVSTDIVRVNPAGEVQVYVILIEFRPEHVAALTALGLRVELTLPEVQLVQGWLPAAALDAIAALDFVKEVRPPGYPARHSRRASSRRGMPSIGPAPRGVRSG